MKTGRPLVSICCLTYNHESYIRDCLEGFVMQRTDFPFEVLIHDDASTDHTADIIREYERKYPDIIKPIYQKENQYKKGISINQTFNYPRAQGKYIALSDGDDYWTDPYKLQKQFDFLEKNKEYIAVVHRYNVVDKNGIIQDKKTFGYYREDEAGRYTLHDFEKGLEQPSQVSTLMYKNFYLEKIAYPDSLKKNKAPGDKKIFLFLLLQGDIYRMQDKMSVYRYVCEDGGASWTSRWLKNYDPYQYWLQHRDLEAIARKYGKKINQRERKLYVKWDLVLKVKEDFRFKNVMHLIHYLTVQDGALSYFIAYKCKKLLKGIINKVPLKNYIVFESYPDCTDNTKYVYDEMCRRGLDNKYKMIWLCSENKSHEMSKKTTFVRMRSKRASYYRIRSKAIICCNRFVVPDSDRQFSIYLGHGTGIKNVGDYIMPKGIQYCLAAGKNAVPLKKKEFFLESDKVVPLGFPRNDDLTGAPVDLHAFWGNDYDKFIVWYPTFRQHFSGAKTGTVHAIPLLWDKDNAIRINNICKEKRILLVIKPHFAQDISFLSILKLSNISFIDDNFFSNNRISSYAFLRSCDAMLTDYSSVYFDYTLCDKPIGLVWEDYDEYDKNPGFAIDMDFSMRGGVKIYSVENMLCFLENIANNVDRLQKERREIRDYFNISTDGLNSKRVVDFIVEKAKL